MSIRTFILILLILTVFSCKKETIIPNQQTTFDFSYFPLTEGHTVVMKVTDINIDAPSEVYDTSIYFYKYKIDSAYTDLEGDTAFYLIREKYLDLTGFVDETDVWSAKLKNNEAIVTEENISFIKIKFPVQKNQYWNGNKYNNLDFKDFTITNISSDTVINTLSFDKVITIIQEADSSLIHKKIIEEKYAKNIGLIYKCHKDINSQSIIPNIPIESRITRGTIHIEEIFNSQ